MSHLVHLKTFLEVYRVKSISQAAERLAITQPAASLHIQALESLIDKPLFIRQARGVTPTEVADELARSIAPHLDGIATKLQSFKVGRHIGGTVHIAAPQDFLHSRLALSLGDLLNEEIKLRFQIGNKSHLYARMKTGEVDFAITASTPEPQDYHIILLMREKLRLVAAPVWAEKLSQPQANLLEQLPLIAYDEELPLIRQVWQQLFDRHPTHQADFIVPDLRIIKKLVLNGAGWTVLPEYQCQQEITQGKLITANPRHTAPLDEIYLVWHKSHPLSATANYVKDYIIQQANSSDLSTA